MNRWKQLKLLISRFKRFFVYEPVVCKECGSNRVIEEVSYVRGHRPGYPFQWEQVVQRCRDCGSIKTYDVW